MKSRPQNGYFSSEQKRCEIVARVTHHCTRCAEGSPFSVGDSALRQVVRGKFNFDFVSGNDPDKKLSHATGHMSNHFMAAFDLDAKSRVGQRLGYRTFNF